MGLDITVTADNQLVLMEIDKVSRVLDSTDLSRTFCNFMCRENLVLETKPELDQIGEITGVDIQFLYEMFHYTDEFEMMELLENWHGDDESYSKMKNKILEVNLAAENNISRVQDGLKALIDRLSQIKDLPMKLESTKDDTIGINTYFRDFNKDLGDGYIGNNFGQDLRNLLRFVEFGIANGSKTIYLEIM